MLRRLKRRLAPWIAWKKYQRLTLRWGAARWAHAAPGSDAPAEPVRIRAVDRAELERFSRDPVFGISARFLGGLEARSDLCLGGFIGGQLACYGFVAAAPTDIDQSLRFHFPERWLYVYKVLTLPQYRGKRLWQHVLLKGIPAVEQWLGDVEEPIGFVTLIVSDNTPSLKAFGRIGFRHEEDFPVLRLGPRAYPVAMPLEHAHFFIHRIEGRTGACLRASNGG